MADELSQFSYRAALAATLRACFADWHKMDPVEWAEEVYRLPGGNRFSFDYAPYSKRIFLELLNRAKLEKAFLALA